MKYCCYHEVATGVYNCPYAIVVNNTITCTSSEECHSVDYRKNHLEGIYPMRTLQTLSTYELSLNDEDITDIEGIPIDALPF